MLAFYHDEMIATEQSIIICNSLLAHLNYDEI